MDFEFISEDEIQGVKRGRKSTVPAELVELIRKVPKGQAVVLKDHALNPASETYGKDKASKSAMIRTAGKQAGLKVSTVWTPSGLPQVRIVGSL